MRGEKGQGALNGEKEGRTFVRQTRTNQHKRKFCGPK